MSRSCPSFLVCFSNLVHPFLASPGCLTGLVTSAVRKLIIISLCPWLQDPYPDSLLLATLFLSSPS